MISIEKNIDQFYQETEQSVKEIIEGSDEHLDMILSVTTPLNVLSGNFEKLNEAIYNNINDCADEQVATVILPKLRLLNKSCLTLIGAIRTSFLYRDVRDALKRYTKQCEALREIIYDIQNIRLTKDDEFDNLLKELNEL